MLLKLTDAQLDTVYNAAGPLQPDDRGAFLQKVADMLGACCEIGDGVVGLIAALAQKEFMRAPELDASMARKPTKYSRAG